MVTWTDLYGAEPDYPAQTVAQQEAHALADRLEARAARYETAARSAWRRTGRNVQRGPTRTLARRRLRHYTRKADRLRDAARVVREEADR